MTNQKTMRIDHDTKAGKITARTTAHIEQNDEYEIPVPNYMAGHRAVIAGMILEVAASDEVDTIEVPRGGFNGVLADELVKANLKLETPLRIVSIADPKPPAEESIDDAEPKLAGTIDPATIGTGSQAAVKLAFSSWVIVTAERYALGDDELRWFRHHVDSERTPVHVSSYGEKTFRLLSHLSPEGRRVEVGS